MYADIDTGNLRMTRELLQGKPAYRSVRGLQLQIRVYSMRHAVGKVAYVCGLHIGKGAYNN